MKRIVLMRKFTHILFYTEKQAARLRKKMDRKFLRSLCKTDKGQELAIALAVDSCASGIPPVIVKQEDIDFLWDNLSPARRNEMAEFLCLFQFGPSEELIEKYFDSLNEQGKETVKRLTGLPQTEEEKFIKKGW